MSFPHVHRVITGVGFLILLIVGFSVFQDTEHPENSGVRSGFLPVEKMESVGIGSGEITVASLEDLLKQRRWTALLIFRPTDCYSCVMYGAKVPGELHVDRYDQLQVAAIGIDTNEKELRSFLRPTDLPYPVYVAPASSETEGFYQTLSKIGKTPLLVLVEGQQVHYATRLLPGEEKIMEDRYASVLDYISDPAE